MKAKNRPQEKNNQRTRKEEPEPDSVFAGYLEEFSVGKMNQNAIGFPIDRDNLYLGESAWS